jgi:serine/threonine protein kinase
MAPEQLRGQRPSPGTDVFSLGVIAYEMLVGELPFGTGIGRGGGTSRRSAGYRPGISIRCRRRWRAR